MKLYLFGCKETTIHVAKFIKELGYEIHLITIDPETAKKNQVAGYFDMSQNYEIFSDIYIASSYSLTGEEDIQFFRDHESFDLGFCIGWQRLIPSHVLSRFSKGVHGMHGSARDLPYGKGRSPMNWSIIEGRKFFFTNLFKYEDGVDSGPIVDRMSFSITDFDTAETLHFKNTLSMCSMLKKNLPLIIQGKIFYRQQKNVEKGTFYPKRESIDSLIDWRDDIENIDRLVRAVSNPFGGGITHINSNALRIFRSQVFYTDLENHPFQERKFGEICDIFPNEKFLVRCSGGILLVHEHDGKDLDKNSVFDQIESPFKRFSRNVYGFFDIE